jgi:ribosomal protein S18 acetylase RimI-like enzyme
MERRALDMGRDYPSLLSMYRLSWGINFPGAEFHEPAFRSWVASGALRDEITVYEIEGQLVGWLWLDLSSRHVGHVVHVQVERGLWGQGLGREIMEDAIAQCLESGCKVLTLAVTKTNGRALALYRSLGFAVVEDEAGRQKMKLELAHA